MEIKLKDIIKQLITSGHDIRYRNRSDGGVIITSIDGVKYTGASGNNLARQMVGVSVSSARAKANLKLAEKHSKKASKRAIDKDLTKALKHAQRVYNKAKKNGKKKGSNNISGSLTKKRVSDIVRHMGKEEALRSLSQAERYAMGLLYDRELDALIERVKITAKKRGDNPEIAVSWLESHRNKITDDIWNELKEFLYQYEQEVISITEMVRLWDDVFSLGGNPFKN